MNGNLCHGKMCMNLVANIIPAPKHFTIMQRLHYAKASFEANTTVVGTHAYHVSYKD